MARLFADNAETTLAAGIGVGDTSITVASGSLFPSLVSPDYYVVTLTQSGTETSWEKIKVTAKSSNTFTAERGYDNTTPATWSSGDKFEIRWESAAAFNAANTAYSGSAILDFGYAPGGNYCETWVENQADISNNSQCDAWIQLAASPDHNSYEHSIVQMTVRAGDIDLANKRFKIVGYSSERLTGRWIVQWARTL